MYPLIPQLQNVAKTRVVLPFLDLISLFFRNIFITKQNHQELKQMTNYVVTWGWDNQATLGTMDEVLEFIYDCKIEGYTVKMNGEDISSTVRNIITRMVQYGYGK
jgi:UDP-galactopyranose mutase